MHTILTGLGAAAGLAMLAVAFIAQLRIKKDRDSGGHGL